MSCPHQQARDHRSGRLLPWLLLHALTVCTYHTTLPSPCNLSFSNLWVFFNSEKRKTGTLGVYSTSSGQSSQEGATISNDT